MSRLLPLVLALAVLASGCRSASDGDAGEVVFWAMGKEGEAVRRLVGDFERETGIRVRVQQVPWGAAHEKLLTAFVGETLPDAFQVGNTWIPELAALGALARLDERVEESPDIDRKDYFPGIWDTNVLDEGCFGIPWYVDTRLFFVRHDLLRQVGISTPPSTWDGWEDALERLRQRPGSSGHAILLPLSEWQLPVILALQREASLLREHESRGHFQDPRFRAAFEAYVSFFARGLAPPAGAAQAANLYQDFAGGVFPVFVSGPWNLAELRARMPEEVKDGWSTVEMPGVSVAGGSSLVLSSKSRRPAQAWRWIEYLSRPRSQERFYELSGDLPPRRATWARPRLASDIQAQAFARQLARTRATPKIPEWERIASRITQYAEAVVRQNLTVEAALRALEEDTDAILEKRRWLLARRGRAS